MKLLTFGVGNMKLKKLAKFLGIAFSHVVAFDLPAGWTCPKANICKTFADKVTGKMTKVGRIVCYACKSECSYPAVRASRWRNFDAMKACASALEMAELIISYIGKRVEIVRIHSSGDFFSAMYFEAWQIVAMRMPHISFFAYTKVLKYALAELPDNFHIVYSYGSKDDTERDAMETPPPTCYIREKLSDYPDIKTLCGSPDRSHEDYFAILAGETFVLDMH